MQQKYSPVPPFRWETRAARKLLQNPRLPRCLWKSILPLVSVWQKKTSASHTGSYIFFFIKSFIVIFFVATQMVKWLRDVDLAQTSFAFSYLWPFCLPGLASECLHCPRETYQGGCFYNSYKCHCSIVQSVCHIQCPMVSNDNYLLQGSSPNRQLWAGVWKGWNVGQVDLMAMKMETLLVQETASPLWHDAMPESCSPDWRVPDSAGLLLSNMKLLWWKSKQSLKIS